MLCKLLVHSSVLLLGIVIQNGMMFVQFGMRGANMPYNPNFADESYSCEYGGYSDDHSGYGASRQQGFGGRGRGRFGGRQPRGFRGRYIYIPALCKFLIMECKHSFIESAT